MSTCIVQAVRNEAAPVLPLLCGDVVYRRLSCRSLVLEELWDPACSKLCLSVQFSVSTSFSCRCTGRRKEKCQCFISAWHNFHSAEKTAMAPAAPPGIAMGSFPIPSYRACKLNVLQFQLCLGCFRWDPRQTICAFCRLFWNYVSPGHHKKGWRVQTAETPWTLSWRPHVPRDLLVRKRYRCWS